MKKNTNNSISHVSFVIAAAAILVAAGITSSALFTPQLVVASSVDNTIEAQERVAVGGILDGNLTVSVNQFSPAAVEIQTGESVTFYAPENSTEVHNVVFDLSNRTTVSGNELPFILPQGVDPEQQLELAPPFNFGGPIIQEQQPDGRQAIIALNNAAYYPTVADQENNTRYLIDVEEHHQLVEEARQQGFFEPQNLSANYTMNGTELVVTSGIVLDVGGYDALFAEEEEGGENTTAATTEATTATDDANTTEAATSPIPPAEIGQENATEAAATEQEGGEEEFPPLPYPILNSFTVTFEQPGTYEYFCSFHPGMWGIVTVVGEEGEAAGEEGEVTASNMTVTTDAADTNATTVTTTPIPPEATGEEDATTTAEEEGEEQEQQQQTTTTAPNPLFE